MTRLILIATVFMLVSGPVLGQTKMVPLADYIAKNPKIDIKHSEYIFSRCAAFYVSMIPLLQDTDQVKVQTVRKMTIASAKTIKLMEKRTGGSFKALTATAMKIIKDMALEYRKEENRHYTLTGNYFAGNLLLKGDNAICVEVTK